MFFRKKTLLCLYGCIFFLFPLAAQPPTPQKKILIGEVPELGFLKWPKKYGAEFLRGDEKWLLFRDVRPDQFQLTVDRGDRVLCGYAIVPQKPFEEDVRVLFTAELEIPKKPSKLIMRENLKYFEPEISDWHDLVLSTFTYSRQIEFNRFSIQASSGIMKRDVSGLGVHSVVKIPKKSNKQSVILFSVNGWGTEAFLNTETPFISKLKNEAITIPFGHSSARHPWGAQASLLSGLAWEEHGIPLTPTLYRPEKKFSSIAQSFQRSGYTTYAFVGFGGMTPDMGFAEGFDHFFYYTKRDDSLKGIQMEVVERLREIDSSPFFLMIEITAFEDMVKTKRNVENEEGKALYHRITQSIDDLMSSIVQLAQENQPMPPLVVIYSPYRYELTPLLEQKITYQTADPTVQVPIVFYSPAMEPREILDSDVELFDIGPTILSLVSVKSTLGNISGVDFSLALTSKIPLGKVPGFIKRRLRKGD
ncbi:MAG: hypothetical protein KCHDKBKB_02627 [Elusimicrobia bacterium]|nr:hypothetical protein [Elusimicrobiota bacterium]